MEYQEVNAKGYDKICTWYEQVTKESTYGLDYVSKAIEKDKIKSSALDVGCGVGGAILAKLSASGYEITGLDFSPKMLEIARSRHPEVRFIEIDFMNWASDNQYSLIIAWDSIFHLPTSLQSEAIKKLCGYLEPGGVLVFTGGGVEGDIKGEMNGVMFSFGSLSYIECLNVINEADCEVLTMERDQEEPHMVYICRKMTNKSIQPNG